MAWKHWFVGCVLAAGLAGLSAGAGAAPGVLPFGPGECLRFSIKFGVVRAGNATLAVEAVPGRTEGPVVRFVSTASSSRFFSTFFRVEDRITSEWAVLPAQPLRFEKHVHEGKYSRDVQVRFDHDAGVAVYDDGTESPISPGVQDILSAFYYVRTRDLHPGAEIVIPNHADRKNHSLRVRVLKRETVKVKAGRFRCVVVEPLLESAGLFKQEGKLRIWLTDDRRRMPVLMKSKVAVGAITAELRSYRTGFPLRPVEVSGGRAGR